MLKNYFKVACRNIVRRGRHSVINAFGLGVGIAFCVLIYLYIVDENSFDQSHVSKDRIYRLETKRYDPEHQPSDNAYIRGAWLQTWLAPILKQELPEVEFVTRFNTNFTGMVRHEDLVFTERITYADGDFFKMFSFPLVSGPAEKIFTSKEEIVITATIVRKYFGADDPIGKTMEIDVEGKSVV